MPLVSGTDKNTQRAIEDIVEVQQGGDPYVDVDRIVDKLALNENFAP